MTRRLKFRIVLDSLLVGGALALVGGLFGGAAAIAAAQDEVPPPISNFIIGIGCIASAFFMGLNFFLARHMVPTPTRAPINIKSALEALEKEFFG